MPVPTPEVLIAVSASLSACACAAMVVCFFVFEESRRCGRRLLFCLHVTDLVGSAAWLLTLLPCIAAPPLHSTIPLPCFLQGYALLFSSLSSYLWTSCFAFHLYQIMWKQNKTPEMYELRYLLLAWGLPTLILMAFAVQHACGFVLVGFGGLPWCWIRSWSGGEWSVDGFTLQMVFFYGPVVCAALFNMSMFVFLASKLGSASAVMSTAMENKVRRRMMGYISIFLLTSVWGALGRTFQVISPGHELSPVFLTLTAFFTPLQGLLNCLVYGLNSTLRNRLWISLRRLRGMTTSPPIVGGDHRRPLVRQTGKTVR